MLLAVSEAYCQPPQDSCGVLAWGRELPKGFLLAPTPFPGLNIFPVAEQSLLPNWKFKFV